MRGLEAAIAARVEDVAGRPPGSTVTIRGDESSLKKRLASHTCRFRGGKRPHPTMLGSTEVANPSARPWRRLVIVSQPDQEVFSDNDTESVDGASQVEEVPMPEPTPSAPPVALEPAV